MIVHFGAWNQPNIFPAWSNVSRDGRESHVEIQTNSYLCVCMQFPQHLRKLGVPSKQHIVRISNKSTVASSLCFRVILPTHTTYPRSSAIAAAVPSRGDSMSNNSFNRETRSFWSNARPSEQFPMRAHKCNAVSCSRSVRHTSTWSTDISASTQSTL